MRLTEILYKELIRVHNIPYRYRGKHRIEKKPTYRDIAEFKRDLEREEQNMLLLRHPYLTVEQSHGHMHEFNKNNFQKFLDVKRGERNLKFSKRITIVDRLNYYMANEAWE